MPRFVHPDLLDTYRRPNPNTEFRIEVSAPDAVNVIRRADQFTTNPPLVPPMIPANSMTSDARGSLILAPTTSALAGFAGEQSSYDLNNEDISRRLKGVAWTMDPAFTRAVARSVTARVQRVALAGFFFPFDFECQIYRVTKTPGVKEKYDAAKQNYTATAFTDYSFTPLLSPAPVIKAAAVVWDGTQKSTLSFDLSNYALVLENTPTRAAAPDQTGELPKYYIVVRVLNAPSVTGLHRWLTDTASSRVVAGVGTFQRSFWARNNDQEQWAEQTFADVPTFALNIDTYPVTGQAWYAIDVGKAPAANAIGRVVFDRFLPPGTTADLQLSSTGPASGFAFVNHGDNIAVRQQLYWLSVRLFSDANHRASPTVAALGVEWRIPLDVSVEGVPALPVREVSLPWAKASIAEGSLAIVRTGVRDYLDTASVIGSTQPPSQLECDIYLASRHPNITRDKWLLLERMSVTNRTPSATDEVLTLLSFASKLKPKIPRKVESISAVHTVQAGTTAAAVLVSPVLVGTSVSGNEYDGKSYYLRVRSTSSANFKPGAIYTIQGNTGTGQLDFTPAMPAVLATGDVIEVHSGIFTTQAISWNNADLADVWYQLLTTYLGIAPEKIGLGYLPRGGKPPRVTDIAPGDATTQGKLLVTMKISQLEPVEDLLAQVSAILGGVTTESQGQIVYVQLFPLRAPDGTVTVPLPPVSRVFDRRDYGPSLQTPPGLEARATVMSATYGVPLTAAAPDNFQKQTTVSVDNDALLWHTKQDLEDFGSAEVPDKIARWFYNTNDNGLYAASALATTMVRALSTGLRVFPFDVAEINPDLMVGDSVVVVTDQYTDYEPSSRTPLRGMLAVRGVLVRVGNLGRTLGMFVPGLLDNVATVQGGVAGGLVGLGPPIAAPILSGTFDTSGQLFVTSQGEPRTSFQRIAVGTVEPTDAFTRGGTNIPGQNLTAAATGLTIAAGASVWLKAFAYDGYGNESLAARVQITRQGSGTAAPPVAFVTPTNSESDDALRTFSLSATAGSGGGGANLTWVLKQKIGFAAETTLSSGNATTLPIAANIVRHPRSDKAMRFVITDTATGLTDTAYFSVPAARPEIDNTGTGLTSGVTESGGRPVAKLYAKALVADPDTADAVVTGTLKRVIPFTVIRASDDYVASGVANVASIDTKLVGEMTRAISSSLWSEQWDTIDTTAWSIADGGQGGSVALQSDTNSTKGRNCLVATNYKTMAWNGFIPVDANKLYRFRVRTRRTADAANALYVGFLGYKYDNTPANNNSGARYILEAGSNPLAASGWVERTCYMKGATLAFTSTADGLEQVDPATPSAFNSGTVNIRPYMLLNYATAAGQFMVDYFDITEYDEDGSGRTYTVLDIGQKLKTAAKESGGVAVNRLLAKGLAADPNTLDATGLDGTTYKRIVSVNGSGQITPPSSAPRSRAKVKLSANQSITNATDTAIAWNSEQYDTGLHDNVTNNTQLIVPSGGNTGVWLLVAQIQWDAITTGGAREVRILKDSTTIIGRSVVQPTSETGLGIGTIQTVVAFDDAPTVSGVYEVYVRQDTGAARNVVSGESFFAATHLW